MSVLPPIVRNPSVIILGDQNRPPLRWDRVFSAPVTTVELEIGVGKGMFLRRRGCEHPETGFIGVEKSAKFFRICAERLARDGRPNVRIVCSDAFDFMARWVPVASVAIVHVYFPDPWPKKRHAKRRLLSPTLFDLSARTLHPDGIFAVATDVGAYFESAAAALDVHPAFTRAACAETDSLQAATNYAVKYAREGRPLYFGRWRRNASEAPPLPPPPFRRRMSASSVRVPAEGASP